MTSTLESRLERLAETLLHAERGAYTGSSTSRRSRSRVSARRSPGAGMSGHTGVAEQVAGIIEALHPDDLEALVRRLDERRAGD